MINYKYFVIGYYNYYTRSISIKMKKWPFGQMYSLADINSIGRGVSLTENLLVSCESTHCEFIKFYWQHCSQCRLYMYIILQMTHSGAPKPLPPGSCKCPCSCWLCFDLSSWPRKEYSTSIQRWLWTYFAKLSKANISVVSKISRQPIHIIQI